MSAITSIPDSYTIEFGNSFDIAYQQMATTLRGTVDEKPGSGERVRDQILDTTEMQDYSSRGGETVYTDITSDLWNVFPQAFDKANLIDEWDEAYLGEVVLPTSPIVQTHAAAYARKFDNVIVRAFTANAMRGKNGTTSSSFDTTNNRVAVDYKGPDASAANDGLNFYKIVQAGQILDENEVPDDGNRYFGLRGQQMAELAYDIITNHADNLSSLKMMPGTKTISEFYGFKFVSNQRWLVADSVTSAGTDVASCIAWHKSALQLCVWGDRNTRMDVLPQRRHALQIRTVGNLGATRKRDGGIVEVLADQSP